MAKIVISGPPASGKSTLALRTSEVLRDLGEPLYGFTTAEIRRGGRRTGFTVTGLAGGVERILAVRAGAGPRVGSYGVDVGAFEEVALLEVEGGLELGATLVVDEVGKMELLSPRFTELLPAIFAAPRVLVTTQQPPHPALEAVLAAADVRRVVLPRSDRLELPQMLATWLLDEDRAAPRSGA